MHSKHNWNQIHRVVTIKLGFIQISTYRNEFLYYQRGSGPVLPIQKSNSLTVDYVKKVIPYFGISYVDFLNLLKTTNGKN